MDFTSDTQIIEHRTLNIGVVDDEPLIRELLQDHLEEKGHRVTCCETPLQMLLLLRRERYDAILSDIKMPFMTGIEFYERVQELYPRQAERIVFLSGDLMGAATRHFLERTGCLYLAKPFRQATLLAKIEEAVQRSSSEEAYWEYTDALSEAA